MRSCSGAQGSRRRLQAAAGTKDPGDGAWGLNTIPRRHDAGNHESAFPQACRCGWHDFGATSMETYHDELQASRRSLASTKTNLQHDWDLTSEVRTRRKFWIPLLYTDHHTSVMKRALRVTGALIGGAVIVLVILGLFVKRVSYTTTIDVAAPVETAWATFVDGDRLGEWMPGFTGAELLEGEEGAVGSLHRLYFETGDSLDERVTAIVPNERYSFDMETSFFNGRVDVTFAPHSDGARIVQTTVVAGSTFHWRALLPVFKPLMQKEQMKGLWTRWAA